MSTDFPNTRDQAQQRLNEFLKRDASQYGRERNFVRPGHPNVSRLSAAIRHRLITEDEVIRIPARIRHPIRLSGEKPGGDRCDVAALETGLREFVGAG